MQWLLWVSFFAVAQKSTNPFTYTIIDRDVYDGVNLVDGLKQNVGRYNLGAFYHIFYHMQSLQRTFNYVHYLMRRTANNNGPHAPCTNMLCS